MLSLLLVIPMALVISFAPLPASGKPPFSSAALIFLPVLYALAGLIFVPLGCWVYNLAAKLVGGLQISVTDDSECEYGPFMRDARSRPGWIHR